VHRPRRTSPARLLLAAAAALGSAAALSCGASIQAVYEGDIRFEHCMALDSRPDVKPTLRRACWEEWVNFYTYGQTRDRIDYAHHRQTQLASASDFDEGDWAPLKASGPSAVPEPTSALAPPPMLLATDAGTGPSRGGPDASGGRAPPANACAAECEQSLELCRQNCKNAPCEKACSARYKRCARRCS
jgi:hypothetical protein